MHRMGFCDVEIDYAYIVNSLEPLFKRLCAIEGNQVTYFLLFPSKNLQ